MEPKRRADFLARRFAYLTYSIMTIFDARILPWYNLPKITCADERGGGVKKRNRTLWAALVVGLMAMLILIALVPNLPREAEAGTEPEQVTIHLVYAYQNSQWNACIEDIVRQFEDANANINVEYEIHYEDQVYEDVLNRMAARDELGDVIQLKEPRGYAESGLIAPLPAELTSQVKDLCVLNGETYAVAALESTTGIIYNKALFERYGLTPPSTYDDFLRLCARLKRLGVTPLGVGGKELWHLEYWLNHFLRADVLSVEPEFLALCEAGERNWNDPLIATMLAHMAGLFESGYVDTDWRTTPDNALSYHLSEGEVAMVYSGPWLAADVLELAPDMDLGWFYVPNEAGETVAGESLDVYWAVTAGCARDEARYEAAVSFLNFFYADEVYASLCAALSGSSTLVDAERGSYDLNGILSEIVDAGRAADRRESAYIGNADTPAGFEKMLLNLLVELCSGTRSVEETQRQAQEAWVRCQEVEAAYE